MVDHRLRINRGLTPGHLLHQRIQLVEAGLQRGNQRPGLRLAAYTFLQQRLHCMREITNLHQAGNARTTLERMQVTAQFDDVTGVFRLRMPQRQHVVRVVEQLTRFVKKYLQQIGVDRANRRCPNRRPVFRCRCCGLLGCGPFCCGLLGGGLLGGGLLGGSLLRGGLRGGSLLGGSLLGGGLLGGSLLGGGLRGGGLLGGSSLGGGLLGGRLLGGGLLGCGLLGGNAPAFCLRSLFRLKGAQRRDQLVSEQVVVRVGGQIFSLGTIACHRCADDFPTIRVVCLPIQICCYRGVHIAMYRICFIHRRTRHGCRYDIIRARLKQHVCHLRLGIPVTQRDQLRSQCIHVWQLWLRCVELAHDAIDHIDCLCQRLHTLGGQRLRRCTQTLEQHFQRRQQLRQQRDIDHGDGAVQGMHRAQKLFADRQLAATLLYGRAQQLHILRNLAAQDLQQHRIHGWHDRQADDGLRLGRCVRRNRVGIGQAGLRYARGIDPRHAPAHARGAPFPCRQGSGLPAAPDCPAANWSAVSMIALSGASGMPPPLSAASSSRQCIDRVVHQRLHVRIRLDGVVQHAVEHVLHFPRKLAEHAGADQATGTLERVERAANAGQRPRPGSDRPARFLRRAQVVDLLLHFLQEDLADIVVDTLRVDR